MTLTDLLVPTYRNNLRMLLGLLDKAEAQRRADSAEALLSARLAPDMWPLATQLRLAALQPQEAPLRLLGEPLPGALDALSAYRRLVGFGDRARLPSLTDTPSAGVRRGPPGS